MLPRDLLSFKSLIDRRFGEAVYEGMWFSPLREALQAFLARTQEVVSGEVTLRLFQGSARATGRASPYSLLEKRLATYAASSTFRQDAAVGFIHLYGLANELAYGRLEAARTPANDRPRRTKRAARTVLPSPR